MKKLLIFFVLVTITTLSYAQLSINSITIRTVQVTFEINETEPKEVKNSFDEIPVKISEDILRIEIGPLSGLPAAAGQRPW